MGDSNEEDRYLEIPTPKCRIVLTRGNSEMVANVIDKDALRVQMETVLEEVTKLSVITAGNFPRTDGTARSESVMRAWRQFRDELNQFHENLNCNFLHLVSAIDTYRQPAPPKKKRVTKKTRDKILEENLGL